MNAEQLIEKIRKEKRTPLIGVIGATDPSAEYASEMGIEVGYLLREFMEGLGGSIFTGGVEGVGVDAYIGVVRNCIENTRLAQEGNRPGIDDKFFVLVPIYEQSGSFLKRLKASSEGSGLSLLEKKPYQPPSDYEALGKLSARGYLDIVRAGENMGERREYIAAIADALVVVNGGNGTFDEAVMAIRRPVPVITLKYSGGAAAGISSIKEGITPLVKALLADMRVDVKKLDTSNIYVCENKSQVMDSLTVLF